jgi:hypothetical protein
MKHVYDILDVLRYELRNNPSVNTVSYGDITDLDLDKTTMFPLSHLLIDSASYGERTVTFRIKILCADIVDYNQSPSDFDEFYGNDNLHDVMNTQFQVINSLIMKMRRGSLFNSKYQVVSTPSAEPFKEKYGNVLAGWTTEVEVEVPNSIAICIEGSSSNSSSGGSGGGGSVGGLAPVITSSTSKIYVQVGSSFNYQITATNNPTSYEMWRSPEELSVDESTGLVTGVITTDIGLDAVGVRAINEYGTGGALVYLQTTLNDPSVLLPPDELTATDQDFNVSTGYEFRFGWNYPPYNGDVTIVEVYKNGNLLKTLTNTVGGSKKTAIVERYLSNAVTYSYSVRFGDSEGNFSEMSEPLLVDL